MGLFDWLRGGSGRGLVAGAGMAPGGRGASFAVIDVETTGLSARSDRVLEIAVVRVMGKVSRLTKFLVTDGTFSGTKANTARELGVRAVHPETFRTLLTHLQPAIPTPTPAAVRAPAPVTAPAPPPTTGTDPTPGEIRTWALAAGYVVGDRGRLPREVTDAYRRAHTPAELGGHGTR